MSFTLLTVVCFLSSRPTSVIIWTSDFRLSSSKKVCCSPDSGIGAGAASHLSGRIVVASWRLEWRPKVWASLLWLGLQAPVCVGARRYGTDATRACDSFTDLLSWRAQSSSTVSETKRARWVTKLKTKGNGFRVDGRVQRSFILILPLPVSINHEFLTVYDYVYKKSTSSELLNYFLILDLVHINNLINFTIPNLQYYDIIWF